jgi:hypothetical protein
LFLSSVSEFSAAQSTGYYGKYIGKLRTLHHSVSGDVFAVDARTLHIRDFTYDGEGPGKKYEMMSIVSSGVFCTTYMK